MTLIILSESEIKTKLKKFGYKSFDKGVIQKMNMVILNFIQNALKKGKQQHGGLVMPSEYYGVDSGRFFDDPYPYTDMRPSSEYIRPPMNSTFSGGAIPIFTVSQKNVATFVEEVISNSPVQNKAKVVKHLKSQLEALLTKFVRTIRTPVADHLDSASFDTTLSRPVFKKLQ